MRLFKRQALTPTFTANALTSWLRRVGSGRARGKIKRKESEQAKEERGKCEREREKKTRCKTGTDPCPFDPNVGIQLGGLETGAGPVSFSARQKKKKKKLVAQSSKQREQETRQLKKGKLGERKTREVFHPMLCSDSSGTRVLYSRLLSANRERERLDESTCALCNKAMRARAKEREKKSRWKIRTLP